MEYPISILLLGRFPLSWFNTGPIPWLLLGTCHRTYTSFMTLESLLLSRDPEVVRVIRPTLQKLAIEVEVCQEARAATEILISEKFDAVIVDCDDLQGGLEVLQGLRKTSSNRNSVTFAVLNGRRTTTQEAFGLGANFVLQKPISCLNATRCFHAAVNFMVRERRRYFRQTVRMPVKVTLGDKIFKATATNISEGGIALHVHEALPKGASPKLRFTLPKASSSIEVAAEIAWADIQGRVGLRFLDLSAGSRGLLENWLNEQMEAQLPGAAERIAAAEAAASAKNSL
jgi:DNA-binding response OmpR family regulator